MSTDAREHAGLRMSCRLCHGPCRIDDEPTDSVLAARSRVEGAAVTAYRDLLDVAAGYDHLDEIDAVLHLSDRLLCRVTARALAATLAYVAIRTHRHQHQEAPGEP
jgi:ferritin-like protein